MSARSRGPPFHLSLRRRHDPGVFREKISLLDLPSDVPLHLREEAALLLLAPDQFGASKVGVGAREGEGRPRVMIGRRRGVSPGSAGSGVSGGEWGTQAGDGIIEQGIPFGSREPRPSRTRPSRKNVRARRTSKDQPVVKASACGASAGAWWRCKRRWSAALERGGGGSASREGYPGTSSGWGRAALLRFLRLLPRQQSLEI